jgi:hypothetical protein
MDLFTPYRKTPFVLHVNSKVNKNLKIVINFSDAKLTPLLVNYNTHFQ